MCVCNWVGIAAFLFSGCSCCEPDVLCMLLRMLPVVLIIGYVIGIGIKYIFERVIFK